MIQGQRILKKSGFFHVHDVTSSNPDGSLPDCRMYSFDRRRNVSQKNNSLRREGLGNLRAVYDTNEGKITEVYYTHSCGGIMPLDIKSFQGEN